MNYEIFYVKSIILPFLRICFSFLLCFETFGFPWRLGYGFLVPSHRDLFV